jgi:GcrA cell cycle regulator
MVINTSDTWTDARVLLLKELWAAGKSCAAIAAELGGFGHCQDRGRSAVIGKIHRLKLPHPTSKVMRAGAHTDAVKRIPRAGPVARILAKVNGQDPHLAPQRRNQSNSIAEKLAIAASEPGLPESLNGDKPDGTGVKFIDLVAGLCKWPKGDPLQPDLEFCGCKALPDLPYCAPHTRRAIAPTQSRNRMERAIANV